MLGKIKALTSAGKCEDRAEAPGMLYSCKTYKNWEEFEKLIMGSCQELCCDKLLTHCTVLPRSANSYKLVTVLCSVSQHCKKFLGYLENVFFGMFIKGTP